MALTWVNRQRGNVPPRKVLSVAEKSIDYWGSLLLIASTGTLIASVDARIMETLTTPLRIFGRLLSGLLRRFIYREKTTPSPILDLSLFHIRMFTLSALALMLVGIAQVMIGFVLPSICKMCCI